MQKTTAIKKIQDGSNFGREEFNSLRDDKEVVIAAVKQRGLALEFASDRLKDDKEIVLTAVQQFGLALAYASKKLKDDKEIVFAAVQQSGLALEHASKKLQNDKEVVFAAICQDGNAIFYASPRLKDNKEVVLAAVQEDYFALRFSSDEIQSLCQGQDPAVVLTKAIATEKLHAQLQQEIKPRCLDFAKKLSNECKQTAIEQSRPKSRLKI